MHPFYRFRPFDGPLTRIAWNAIWSWEAFPRLAADPTETERVADLRHRHQVRLLSDGIDHSALDRIADRVPYYCYLGFALGDFGLLPLDGRFGLRWYPVHDVRKKWEQNPAQSAAILDQTLARLRRKYRAELTAPPAATLP